MGFLKIFGGYKKMMASITQIILVVILLPAVCLVLSWLLDTEFMSNLLESLLGEISITQYWLDLLKPFVDNPDYRLGLVHYAQLFEFVEKDIYNICIIGMTVSLCKNAGVLMKIRGIPLLQSIIGVIIGCLLNKYFVRTNVDRTLYICIILIVLNVLIIWLIPSGEFYRKLLATLFGLGLQMIIASLSVAYLAYLTLIINGTINNVVTAVLCLGAFILIFLALLAVDYWLLTPEIEDLGL